MSYLVFEKVVVQKGRRRTEVWEVRNAGSGYVLGKIKWYGGWWQYTFYPNPSTIFNPDCLREIADKCQELTADKRKE